jgi:predicted ATP-binding protein involved in virulence
MNDQRIISTEKRRLFARERNTSEIPLSVTIF